MTDKKDALIKKINTKGKDILHKDFSITDQDNVLNALIKNNSKNFIASINSRGSATAKTKFFNEIRKTNEFKSYAQEQLPKTLFNALLQSDEGKIDAAKEFLPDELKNNKRVDEFLTDIKIKIDDMKNNNKFDDISEEEKKLKVREWYNGSTQCFYFLYYIRIC